MTFSLTHTLHPNPTLWRSQVLVSARLAVDIHEIVRRQTEVDVQTIHVPNQVTDKSSPLESRTFRLYDRGECELFASELMSLVLTVGGYDDPLPNFLDFMRGAGACGLSVCLCVCLCACVCGGDQGSGLDVFTFHLSSFTFTPLQVSTARLPRTRSCKPGPTTFSVRFGGVRPVFWSGDPWVTPRRGRHVPRRRARWSWRCSGWWR
jgi:hypothetical protein